MTGLLRAVTPWVAVLVGMVVMEVLMEALGDAMGRASRRTTTVIQVSWWVFTAAAACAATSWFLQEPASDVRTKVAMFSCVGLPGLGALLAAMAGTPPRIEGRRNHRLRRDRP
jgi:hypothetical protein